MFVSWSSSNHILIKYKGSIKKTSHLRPIYLGPDWNRELFLPVTLALQFTKLSFQDVKANVLMLTTDWSTRPYVRRTLHLFVDMVRFLEKLEGLWELRLLERNYPGHESCEWRGLNNVVYFLMWQHHVISSFLKSSMMHSNHHPQYSKDRPLSTN